MLEAKINLLDVPKAEIAVQKKMIGVEGVKIPIYLIVVAGGPHGTFSLVMQENFAREIYKQLRVEISGINVVEKMPPSLS